MCSAAAGVPTWLPRMKTIRMATSSAYTAQVSIMIRPNISDELTLPAASGWRAMDSTALPVAWLMARAAAAPHSTAMAAAMAMVPNTGMGVSS